MLKSKLNDIIQNKILLKTHPNEITYIINENKKVIEQIFTYYQNNYLLKIIKNTNDLITILLEEYNNDNKLLIPYEIEQEEYSYFDKVTKPYEKIDI